MLPGPGEKYSASRRVLGVLCVATLLCWSPARAAEPAGPPELPKPPAAEAPAAEAPAEPPKRPAEPGKKPGEEKPEEIVVTAGRLPTEAKRSGASTAVVTGEELETRRPVALWEAVQLTPGVTFVQGGTRGQLTSLFMRGGESDHTLVLVDGFKANEDGGGFPWETLSPAGAGRVEVLRGAASALYGAEALTGVVQVFTAKGAGAPRAAAAFETGTYHTFRETAQLVGADGPVAYNLNLSCLDMTGGRFPNSDVRATAFAGRLDWDLPAGGHAELVQHASGDRVGNYESDAIRDPNGRVEHGRELTGLVLSGRLADTVDSRLLLGRSFTTFFYEDRMDSADTMDYRTKKDLERLSAEWQSSAQLYELGPAVGKLAVGAAWEQELGKINARASGTFLGLPYESENFIDRSRSAIAGYAEKRLGLWEALSLDAGARVEDHSTFGTETAVRLAAGLWIERTGTRLHASWGRGLKSPTFFENFDNSYYDLGGGPIYTVGNPDLDPERVTSLDAGIEQRLLGDKLVAGVTVFRNRFRDFIDYRYVSPTLTTYTNAGKALTQGAECELALKPAAWARARGSLTLTHSEAITDQSSVTFSDGQQLIRRPKRVAGAAAEAEPFAPWKAAPAWTRKLTVFVEVLRQAGSVDVDWNTYRRVDLPDWTATNVGLNWEVCKGLRLFGRYENIFDQRIEQVSGITGDKSRFLGGAGYTLAF